MLKLQIKLDNPFWKEPYRKRMNIYKVEYKVKVKKKNWSRSYIGLRSGKKMLKIKQNNLKFYIKTILFVDILKEKCTLYQLKIRY